MNEKNYWVIGFLGFLGFLGLKESIFFVFFIFFAGFRYFWWEKIGTSSDERLIENKNKAASISFKITFVICMTLSLLANLSLSDFKLLYNIQLIVLSLGFATGILLWSYFTYKYDTGE